MSKPPADPQKEAENLKAYRLEFLKTWRQNAHAASGPLGFVLSRMFMTMESVVEHGITNDKVGDAVSFFGEERRNAERVDHQRNEMRELCYALSEGFEMTMTSALESLGKKIKPEPADDQPCSSRSLAPPAPAAAVPAELQNPPAGYSAMMQSSSRQVPQQPVSNHRSVLTGPSSSELRALGTPAITATPPARPVIVAPGTPATVPAAPAAPAQPQPQYWYPHLMKPSPPQVPQQSSSSNKGSLPLLHPTLMKQSTPQVAQQSSTNNHGSMLLNVQQSMARVPLFGGSSVQPSPQGDMMMRSDSQQRPRKRVSFANESTASPAQPAPKRPALDALNASPSSSDGDDSAPTTSTQPLKPYKFLLPPIGSSGFSINPNSVTNATASQMDRVMEAIAKGQARLASRLPETAQRKEQPLTSPREERRAPIERAASPAELRRFVDEQMPVDEEETDEAAAAGEAEVVPPAEAVVAPALNGTSRMNGSRNEVMTGGSAQRESIAARLANQFVAEEHEEMNVIMVVQVGSDGQEVASQIAASSLSPVDGAIEKTSSDELTHQKETTARTEEERDEVNEEEDENENDYGPKIITREMLNDEQLNFTMQYVAEYLQNQGDGNEVITATAQKEDETRETVNEKNGVKVATPRSSRERRKSSPTKISTEVQKTRRSQKNDGDEGTAITNRVIEIKTENDDEDIMFVRPSRERRKSSLPKTPSVVNKMRRKKDDGDEASTSTSISRDGSERPLRRRSEKATTEPVEEIRKEKKKESKKYAIEKKFKLYFPGRKYEQKKEVRGRFLPSRVQKILIGDEENSDIWNARAEEMEKRGEDFEMDFVVGSTDPKMPWTSPDLVVKLLIVFKDFPRGEWMTYSAKDTELYPQIVEFVNTQIVFDKVEQILREECARKGRKYEDVYPERYLKRSQHTGKTKYGETEKNILRTLVMARQHEINDINKLDGLPPVYLADWSGKKYDFLTSSINNFEFTNFPQLSERVEKALEMGNIEKMEHRCKAKCSCADAAKGGHCTCDPKTKDTSTECADSCTCDPASCSNRIVQRGRQVPIIIMKSTEAQGWTSRLFVDVKKGDFIHEYVAELLTWHENKRLDQTYALEQADCLFDMDKHEIDDGHRARKNNKEHSGYCHKALVVNGLKKANEARFNSHGCQPRMKTVVTYVDRRSAGLHRTAFFANRDMRCGEELTWNYHGDEIEEAIEQGKPFASGNVAKCECDLPNCPIKKNKQPYKPDPETEDDYDSFDEEEVEKRKMKEKKTKDRGKRLEKREEKKSSSEESSTPSK